MNHAHTGVTVVGLGPGSWESLTIEAARVLQTAATIYVRTTTHPSFDEIRSEIPGVQIESFDALYEERSSFDDVYEGIVDALLERARTSGGVIYAVPGSPTVGERSVRLLLDRCTALAIPVRVVQGMSHIEPVLTSVGVTDAAWIDVLDASEIALLSRENALGEVDGLPTRLPWRAPSPTAPAIISRLYSRELATGVKLWLGKFYPDDHRVTLVRLSGDPGMTSRDIALFELDRLADIDASTVAYIPPLTETDNVRTFAGLMQLTRTLRAPGGCPWDREQTHSSLKPHLLEEAYEVLDALDGGNPDLIAEELGDLLFQVTIHSQVAAESGEFTIEDVIEGIMRKLIGRHPHVFGSMELHNSQDVRHAWESFKQREKPKRASVLEEIPRGLPALPQSNLIQKRAASVGFEWPNVEEVIAKVEEEIRELRVEIEDQTSRDAMREEFGDILFALVSVARHLRLDPEEALRLANRKFATRFQQVEARVKAANTVLRDLTPDELDRYWNEAKATAPAMEPIER